MRDAADAVGDEARRDAADDAEASMSDSISAPRADAVAEVAAIGDEVHLRHRHGDAAGDAGDKQQDHQRVWPTAAARLAAWRRRRWRQRRMMRVDLPAHAAAQSGIMVTTQKMPMPI